MMRRIAIGLILGCVATSAAATSDMRPPPRPDRTVLPAPVAEVAAAVAEAEPSPLLVMASKSPMPRPANLLAGHSMRLALARAGQGDWDGAAEIARADSPVAADIIEWQRLRAGLGSFADYRAFLARNADWPGLDLLRRKGEAAIPEAAAAAQVIGYFAETPPQTGAGALRLAAALTASGQPDRAKAVLVKAWSELDLSAAEETALLAAHGKLLAPYHATRLDHLLWQRETTAAKRIVPLVDAGHKALAEARMALQARAGDVDARIAAVPAALASDPGLAFDRMRWQVAKRRRDQAADIILATSASAETLGRPEAWAEWREILARQEMREGNPRRAYDLASKHRIKPTSEEYDYAGLEWLAGYIALRHLDDPRRALEHFRAFKATVYTPISLGRAGYWEGRALEALGDAAGAQAAYAEGAKYQTSFYGLLAAEKAGVAMDATLTGRHDAPGWQGAAFTRSSVFAAARLFQRAGQTWETARFLRHLAETTAPEELELLSDYALSLGDPYLAVLVSKQVAREGTVAPRGYYPLAEIGDGALPVSTALALSIARRESEFHAGAVSHAGARGLMQLMPATAKAMAGKLGEPYSLARLTSDPAYNARLGSAYLAHLIEEFGQNYVLVAVGYNAGPHRARSWIEANGDPRDPDVDVIDWIEHIPFTETRNYVMRVTESLPIYRARLSGVTEPIRLSAELKAR